MPKYNYSALRNDGERISGLMEGADRSAVLLRLSGQGHHPIDVSEAEPALFPRRIRGFGRGGPSFSDISLFTRELSWLLSAGLNLSAALDVLSKDSFSEDFGSMIANVRTGIRKGRTLREALSETGVFSQDYVSMIEVGEATGTIAAVLNRIAASRDREYRIRQRIVSALIYPSLLVALALGAIAFIMVFVVPQLKELILESRAPVPESAQFVIAISDWLREQGPTLLVVAPLVVLLMIPLSRNASVRRAVTAMALHVPLIGGMMKKAIVLRFCRMFGTLLSAGVGLPLSLGLMRPSLGNREAERVIGQMENALRQGDDFLVPLEQSKLFPKLLARMLRVGNETGNLTTSILQLTDILEEKFDQAINRTLTLLEPAIILALSVMVALIIISLMSAIISINELAI